MLDYNELTQGRYVVLDGDPYEVLTSHVFRKQQRKPVNQAKLRNLRSGKIIERSFHMAETFHEAEIIEKPVIFIYKAKGECWFHAVDNPGARVALPESMLGNKIKFLKEKTSVKALEFQEEIIGINLPIKLDLAVTEAPTGIKGDTAQGGTKQVTLETGAIINAPLFINEGDIVRVNTETGEYVERAEKK